VIPRTLSALACLFLIATAAANDDCLVSSIPHALSDEQIYKVMILEIDGKPVEPRVHYTVAAGLHVITVQLMLDVEWSPDLSEQATKDYRQNFRLNAQARKQYQLAAKVDLDAPVESQLDGSFWQTVVYRETDN